MAGNTTSREVTVMGFENGKLVRVVLRATAGGDQQVTVLHYDLDDGNTGTPNDPQALADRFRDDVIEHFVPLFNDGWTIQPVEVVEERDPLHPTNPRQGWTSGAATPGTQPTTFDQLPRAVCTVATLRTAFLGKRFRGRIFVPGRYSEDDQSAGLITTNCRNRIQPFLDAIPRQPDIASGVGDAVANWCVYSRTQRAADLDPYASAITDVSLGNAVHWLRSRQEF